MLATLTDDVPFVMEMVVENGRGYVPATEHSPNVQEIGIIPVDAVYSPVVRVRYEIEETRVGQKTNYDKLTIEIWTNGSIGPEMALVEVGEDSSQAPESVRAIYRIGRASRRRGPIVGAGGVMDGAIEQKLNMTLGRFEAFGAGRKLPGERKHSDRSRSSAALGRSVVGSAQLRRDHAE